MRGSSSLRTATASDPIEVLRLGPDQIPVPSAFRYINEGGVE